MSSKIPLSRLRLRVAGQSGSGLMSVGDILVKSLSELGFWVYADREYPSLIKGGHSCFTINTSDQPLHSLSEKVDLLVAIDKPSLLAYVDSIKPGGILIHGYERTAGIQETLKQATQKKITIISLPVRHLAEELAGNLLMQNVILVGMVWRVLGLPLAIIIKKIKQQFGHKPALLPKNIICVKNGYQKTQSCLELPLPPKPRKRSRLCMDGNRALALGAIAGGMRAFFAYPMSPASSILSYLAEYAAEYDYAIKQGEDEITVANLALGASFVGARSLCATSGGGYDLMSETVSLSAMIETPLTIILAQRPGPATGLPTWTAQADLNLVIYSSHGEFTRLVIACSDPSSAFMLIQQAMNYAEQWQIPVIVLTEKVIAESLYNFPSKDFRQLPIKQGLVPQAKLSALKNTDRYRDTPNGVSPRWLPGTSSAYYFANGDEHHSDGSLNEEASAGDMYAKRCRKATALRKVLPQPKIYNVDHLSTPLSTKQLSSDIADLAFVGWGSSHGVMIDIIRILNSVGIRISYLHYSFMYPLRTSLLQKYHQQHSRLHLIEGNHDGQFGNLLESKSQIQLAGRLLKWNGRPFFIEDVLRYIQKHLSADQQKMVKSIINNFIKK